MQCSSQTCKFHKQQKNRSKRAIHSCMMVPQTVLHQSSFRSLIPMAILTEVVFLLHGDVCTDERGKNLPDEDVSTSLVPL